MGGPSQTSFTSRGKKHRRKRSEKRDQSPFTKTKCFTSPSGARVFDCPQLVTLLHFWRGKLTVRSCVVQSLPKPDANLQTLVFDMPAPGVVWVFLGASCSGLAPRVLSIGRRQKKESATDPERRKRGRGTVEKRQNEIHNSRETSEEGGGVEKGLHEIHGRKQAEGKRVSS